MDRYVPGAYWQTRLSTHNNLRGVGHLSFSEGYNAWLYRAKLRTLERALSDVKIPGSTVLDVGVGTGFFVDWYAKKGAIVAGLDIADHSIECIKRRHQGDFRVQDITAIDAVTTSTYDIVNTWDVLYHVVDDEAHQRAVRFIASAVKERGLLLITDMLASSQPKVAGPHVRFRPFGTYQSLLSPLGFEFRTLHFLYRWLNRSLTIPRLDSVLARLYFWLDRRETKIPENNLSLGVWVRAG